MRSTALLSSRVGFSFMRQRSPQSNHAYTALKEKITSGQLVPGAVVSEASLAKELGLSRTPIGEALRRLSHEGLVDQIPRYGTVVRELSATELRELFEIREALEGVAASRAAERIDPATIEDLGLLCDTIDAELAAAVAKGLEYLEEESLRRFLAADRAFHMLIIASANNRKMSELVEQTRSVSSMFAASRGVHSIDRVADANRRHRQICDALTKRDSEAASRLVVAHIRTSCEQSLRQASRDEPSVGIGSLPLLESVRRDLGNLPGLK